MAAASRKCVITGNKVIGSYTESGATFQTYAPAIDTALTERMEAKNVTVTVRPETDGSSGFLSYVGTLLPMLLILGVWLFFMRQMQGGSRGAMGFGKSKAKLLTEAHGRVTFDDVAGVDEAKQDLEEIVEFLRDPQKFQRLGGRIPRGVLLVGPPGTGKTLLARSVAGEANVPFFTISGSDFVEMFVGVGASRVRDMFEQAKKNAPCIIFIDEIDAVGRHRGAGLGGGNDEREQTLNQLLVEMDGFEANEGIILIAATNRPDVLDPALLRPGRFDRQVVVPNPDVIGRERILKVHVRNVPLAPNVDLKVLARGTPGFSGADLMNLVNEAALMAARRNKRVVTMQEFEDAKDKIMMGAERRSSAMTEAEKKLTAYHEAGHAIIALKVAGRRSDAQGDDHSARPCARHGHAASRRRPLFDELQVDGLAPCDHDGWPRRRGNHLRQGEHHLRRILRHREGNQARPRDGDGMGLLRQARPGRLWREPAGSLPRPLGVADQECLGSDVAEDRRRNPPPDRRGLSRSQADHHRNAHGIRRASPKGLLEYETLTGDEIKALIRGEKPARDLGDDSPPHRGSAVPSAGTKKDGSVGHKGDEAEGGFEPQPQ